MRVFTTVPQDDLKRVPEAARQAEAEGHDGIVTMENQHEPFLALAVAGAATERIELHTSVTYLVYFLGFAPGFAYLGGLPEVLASPRLETPRAKVPQGSVGIGGNQTGVYPFPTPGGWRLIGRTPLAMFRRSQTQMNLLQIGDHVRFRAVSNEEYAEFSRR